MADHDDGLLARDRGNSSARTQAMTAARSGPDHRQGRQYANSGRSSPAMVGFALAAAAGVAAIGLIGAQIGTAGSRVGRGPNRRPSAKHEPDVQRSITIEDVAPD